jgi:hypothetical protein
MAQSPWTLSPSLSISGGHESNLLLDPAGAAVVVPGGSFLEFSPGFELARRFSQKLELRVGTRISAERFFNDEDRTLYGHVAWGDLFVSLSARTRMRFSLSGDYFNDTQQSALRRWGGGGELGIDYRTRRFRLEGFVGGRGVSYPRADALNEAGQLTSYREGRWNLGAAASIAPSARLLLRASLVARRTDSVDPQYDGGALLSDLALRFTPQRRLFLDLHYGRQSRDFDHRLPSFDSDLYTQWGVGMSFELNPGASLRLRWSQGTYSDPEGNEQDTDRLELSLRLGPSIFGARLRPALPMALDFSAGDSLGPKQGAEGTVFRLHAPAAATVELMGDFNGWQRGRATLEPQDNGWWQVTLRIPPGRYQYLYMVDGKALTPPESLITVEDGFGGRNGLLEVR